MAISAQMQGVSLEQKPHWSGGATAGMEDDAVEVDVVRIGGRRVANCDVKSISVSSLSSESSRFIRRRLLSIFEGGECGRLNGGAAASSIILPMSNASSIH